MQIRMRENRRVAGTIYTSGSTYTVDDGLGATMVGAGYAVRLDAPAISGSQAFWSLDSSGNVQGLVGPDGGVVWTGPFAASATLLLGDSNSSFWMDTVAAVTDISDNGDGTATVTFSGSHNFAVGQPITVNNAPERKFNVFGAEIVSQVNSGTFSATYRLGGRTSPVTTAGAANTQVLYPLRSSPIGYATWLQALQSRPLSLEVAAAGGADSTQALELLREWVQYRGTRRVSDVVLMIGTNDVYARDWSFDVARASIKALADRVAGSGLGRIWWLTIPPYSSALGTWSEAKQTVVNRLNQWIQRYAPSIGAVPIDTWRAAQAGSTLVNPAASNPDPTSTYIGAGGVHTTNLGALAIARSIDAALRQHTSVPAVPAQGAHPDAQGVNNVLTNPQLTGTGGTKTPGGGTISGNAPDSWTVEITAGSGTVTLTSPARTVSTDGDASGNNLQAIPSAAALTWRLLQSGLHSLVTAGEVRELSIPVAITGAAGLTGVELVVFGTKSAGGNENLGMVGTSEAITGDFSGVLRTQPWTVPSGLTSLSVFLRFTHTGVPAGTFVIGKPALRVIE